MVNNFDYSKESRCFGFIRSDTTPAAFELELKQRKYPWPYDSLTPLAAAAGSGNIPLMEHIFAKGGEPLFTAGNFWSPLHRACCYKIDSKALKAAKKLLQLGSPVNIFKALNNGRTVTPLDVAIDNKNFKTAGFLLRQGGVVSVEQGNLEEAKKEMMPDNLKLFKMHFGNKESSVFIPKEIIDYILSLSNKLELQD